MAKIKKLHPWYLIKLRSSNKDKNSENDEISVTDFTSQLTDTIVDDVTIKKDPDTGNIYVSPDLSVDHSKATNTDLQGSHPASAISSVDKTNINGSVEEQLQTINDDAVFRDINGNSEGNVTMSERTILSGTNLGANADIIESILGGGTTGQVLKSIGDGTPPTWQDESGGGGADSRKSRVAYNTIMNSNY